MKQYGRRFFKYLKSKLYPSLSEFFRASPFVGVELDLTRDKTPARRDVIL